MADVKAPMVALADHPRAAYSIRQIKAWGGLIGFVVVVGYSYMGGMAIPDALLRGVIAGVLAQMLAWAAGIVLWQHLLEAETRMTVARAVEGRRADAERSRASRGDK